MFNAHPALISTIQDELDEDPNAGNELEHVYTALKVGGVSSALVLRVGTKLKDKRGPRGAGPANVAAVLAAAAFQLGYRTALAQLKEEEEKPANVQ